MGIDLIYYCWIVFILVWIISAFSVKPAIERESRLIRLAALAFLTFTFLLLAGVIDISVLSKRIFRDSAAIHIAGQAFVLVGLLVAFWARYTLGRNWSGTVTIKQDHELIKTGPYRFVRHPIYTGLLFMILGTALASGKIGAFLALVLFSFAIWRKLRREEALLAKYFLDDYQAYMSQTKALIPFLL